MQAKFGEGQRVQIDGSGLAGKQIGTISEVDAGYEDDIPWYLVYTEDGLFWCMESELTAEATNATQATDTPA